MKKKKLLIITCHYLDQNNGGSNCSKANIRAFSELFEDCSLIYPEHNDKSSIDVIPRTLTLFPCYDKRSKIKKGIDIYMGILHRFNCFVKDHLKAHVYDIIVIDHSLTASGIIRDIKETKSKIITIHHNVEREYIKDNAVNLLYRIPYSYYAKKAEVEALNESDLNITLTENDKNYFTKLFPYIASSLQVLGTFLYVDLPIKVNFPHKDNNFVFVISGSLNYPQSEKAIVDFMKKYYPIIIHHIPNASLIVAGRNPSKNIVEILKSCPNVTLVPNPNNMNDIIKKGNYYICPLNTGSGVKLRVMDGLKNGLPIIAHNVSVNGYEEIEKDGYVFGYSNLEELDSIMSIISNNQYPPEKIYQSFVSFFSFPSGKERLKQILLKSKLL